MRAVYPNFEAQFPPRGDAHKAPGTPTPSPDPDASSCAPGACRLNLLLSYAGWHPDPWVDRLPRLLEPLGIVSHRAGSGRQAQQVIKTIPIHIAVVDLGLPLDLPLNLPHDLTASAEAAAQAQVDPASDPSDDYSAPELEEGGSRLLELLHRLDQPPPTVVVKRARSQRGDHRDMAEALRLGAFAVVDRPRDAHDLNLMLDVLRRCLARFYEGRWPDPPA
jgi:hypothetical protein